MSLDYEFAAAVAAGATIIICPYCSNDVTITSQQGPSLAPPQGRRRAMSISAGKKEQHQHQHHVADEGEQLQLSQVQIGLLAHLETCLIEGEMAVITPAPSSTHNRIPLQFDNTFKARPVFHPHQKAKETNINNDYNVVACLVCEELLLLNDMYDHALTCLSMLDIEVAPDSFVPINPVFHKVSVAKLPHPSQKERLEQQQQQLPSSPRAHSSTFVVYNNSSASAAPSPPSPQLQLPVHSAPEPSPKPSTEKTKIWNKISLFKKTSK